MIQNLEALKQQYDFEAWFGRNLLDRELFIWKYHLDGEIFPDWESARIRTISAPGRPDGFTSVWRRPGEDLDLLLTLDIYECDSRMQAQEFLLAQLGNFMSPLIVRRDDLDVGDVAFGEQGTNFLLFSRANLVVSFGNGGRDLVAVPELAQQLDQSLFQVPEVEPLPLLADLVLPVFDPGEPPQIALDLLPLDLPEGIRNLRFFSTTGRISRDDHGLIYRAAKAGLQETLLYTGL